MGSAGKTQAESGGRRGVKEPSPRRRIRRARDLLREARQLLKKKRKRVSPAAFAETSAASQALVDVLPKSRKEPIDATGVSDAGQKLDRLLTDHFGRWRKSTFREYVEAVVWAVGLALIIRAFIFEAFSIPSGSMMPTLQIGDYLFVDKITHGLYVPFSPSRLIHWSEPDRGDIIVFEYRNSGDLHDGEDFIKRVVAVSGDSLRLENNRIVLNGEAIPTQVTDANATCDFYAEDNAERPAYHCPCVRQEETMGEGRDRREWDAKVTTQHVKIGRELEQGCESWCGESNEACAAGNVVACATCRFRCKRTCEGQGKPNWSLSYITREVHPLERISVRKFRPEACQEPDRDPDLQLGVPGCDSYDGRADLVVPEGHVFVMGDNRDHSKDGRFWGFVPVDRIKGRAFVIWMARDKSRIFTWL